MSPREPDRPSRRPCRHDDIVGAATDLFLTRGYAQTSMAMVARRAGCSVGHLYRHVPGKRELLAAVVAGQVDAVDAIRREVRATVGLSPLGCLRRQLQLFCNHLGRQPLLVAVVASSDLVTSATPECFRDRVEREDAELFRLASEAGEIVGGDPRQLAAAFYGIVSSLVMLTSATDRPELFATIPAVVERLFLEPLVALRPPPGTAAPTQR